MALAASFFFAPVFPLAESYSVDASAALGLDYGPHPPLGVAQLPYRQSRVRCLADPARCARYGVADGGRHGAFRPLHLHPAGRTRSLGKAEAEGRILHGAARFLFATSFPLFLLAAGLAQASHGMMYSFSSMHWQSLGFSSLVIGLMWTVAVLAEVTLLAFSNRVVERFGPGTIFLAGISGGALRWLLLAFVQSLPVLMVLQTLHAASFALTHLGPCT